MFLPEVFKNMAVMVDLQKAYTMLWANDFLFKHDSLYLFYPILCALTHF